MYIYIYTYIYIHTHREGEVHLHGRRAQRAYILYTKHYILCTTLYTIY